MSTARTSSCHRVKSDPIDPDNFEDFHNIPAKRLARQQMLDGEWPGQGCEYCENVEKQGKISDRLLTLSRQHHPEKVPPELYVDPTALEVTPTTLEIYFNNTCNFSCAYCSPIFSSKINDELRKFGDIKIDHIPIFLQQHPNHQQYEKMVSDLWRYLHENDRYKVIRHYHVLGGEPLLQRELDTSIEFWREHPNPSLTFNIITNLSLAHDKFQEKIQKFQDLVENNNIYQLELTASIDCWGDEQEYVRHGLDLDVWTKNFEYLLDKSWIRLSVHSCLCSLTIKTLPDLLDRINHWNSLRPGREPIDQSFDVAIGWTQSAMHPKYFGPDIFADDFSRILEKMPEDTDNQRLTKNHMEGLARFVLSQHHDPDKIHALQKYLDELDSRRGTNWRDVFPWLQTAI